MRPPLTVLIALFALLGVDAIRAQLVVRTPRQNWRPGEIVEIALPEEAKRGGVRVRTVHFNDLPIPFELVQPAGGDRLLRIRVPLRIRSGVHAIKIFLTDEEVVVPSIRGLTLEEAETRVRSAGLRIDSGGFSASESEFSVDRVEDQNPAPGGRARRGSRIAVEVSRHSIVPEIVGLPLQEAREKLEERGLQIATPELISGAESTSGLRIGSQDPRPGDEALLGALVRVGIGVVVPDLLGMEIEHVRRILGREGLPLLLVTRSTAEGPFETALLQQPAPGSLVAPGTPVRVTIENQPNWLLSLWPIVLLTGILGAAWTARARFRRLALRRSYRLNVSRDLTHLRRDTPPPIWRERELKLDVRLVGHLDSGNQTICVEGPLLEQSAL